LPIQQEEEKPNGCREEVPSRTGFIDLKGVPSDEQSGSEAFNRNA
jgi:hypothetical protein